MVIKAVYGGATISRDKYPTEDKTEELLQVLKKNGVINIDTARLYGESEAIIGQAPSHTDFIIDTKLPGGFSVGSGSKDQVIADVDDSIKRCEVKQFDILYLHAPDKGTPIEETLEGINEAYKKGQFKRFGLSNFSEQQVQEVYDLAKSKGYVVPSAYQGSYNPVARKIEDVFPLLRKLGMAFYAYSPIAGGFLTKTLEQLDAGAGRFNAQAVGGIYNELYNKPAFRDALADWNAIAAKEGVSNAELAYRWVGYNSLLKEELGDAVIFGSSKLSQVEQTAGYLKKGKVSDEASKAIDAIWKKVEPHAYRDNFDMVDKRS